MGQAHLLDTNTIIYFLKGKLSDKDLKFIEKVIHQSFNLSIITKIELLCWKTLSNEEAEKIRELISYAKIYPLEDDIAKIAISVRRDGSLKLPDSVIASTAIARNLKLITSDKQLAKISQMDILVLTHL